jgi:hypothetical protein
MDGAVLTQGKLEENEVFFLDLVDKCARCLILIHHIFQASLASVDHKMLHVEVNSVISEGLWMGVRLPYVLGHHSYDCPFGTETFRLWVNSIGK